MERIHFLNVNEGACSLVEHASGRKTLIDICSGNLEEDNGKTQPIEFVNESTIRGNYHFKEHLTNPITYLHSLKINIIFRFILTHPDMDHMDGIQKLFDEFCVQNFWDTANNKKESGEFKRYRKEDWDCYQNKRKEGKHKILHLVTGSIGCFYNRDEDESNEDGGDRLNILAPTNELVNMANKNGNHNNSSYVILYTTRRGRKILFPGDSEKIEWDFLTEKFSKELENIDVLIAPHHGRCTGGNGCFLDIMKPKLTLFGNASSEYLNYNDWNNRGLAKITSNEAGNVLIEQQGNGKLMIYVENYRLADSTLYEGFPKCIGGVEYYHYMCI